jgi:hypothetical protein
MMETAMQRAVTRRIFLAAAIACLGISRSASADLVVYATTAQGGFGLLDLDTGVYTATGSTGIGSPIVGMGLIGGTLFGVDNAASGAGFYSIDTATGAATLVNTLGVTASGGTTAFGSFYGLNQDDPTQLFQSGTSGNGSVINTNPTFPAGGLVALDSSAQNLYVSASTGGGDDLYRIERNGGTVVFVGSLSTTSVTGLIFGSTLYSIDGSSISTYTVGTNPDGVTGPLTTTAITGLDRDQVSAVAAGATAAVPEPATLASGGLGILLIACGAWWRRRPVD